MKLIPIQSSLFKQLFAFEVENRGWFETWVPPRPADFYQYEQFVVYCEQLMDEIDAGEGLYFIGFDNGEMIGRFNLTFTKQGTADIGYRVAKNHIGKGYANYFTAMLIEQAKLAGATSVSADALQENVASTRVLKKLGFERVPRASQVVRLGVSEYKLVPYQLSFT